METTEAIADGFHKDIPDDVYHGDKTRLSVSRVKPLMQSPLHYRWALENPKESDALSFGRAFDSFVFGGQDALDEGFAFAPKCDRRTKAGKAAYASFERHAEGKEVLKQDDKAKILAMHDALQAHPIACQLLWDNPGTAQLSQYWTDPKTGHKWQGRMDRYTTYENWSVIVDLKTCVSASPGWFSKSIGQFAWHLQSGAYLYGANVLDPRPRRFMHVVIEKEEPFAVAVYELGPESVDEGTKEYHALNALLAKCEKENRWPGYCDDRVMVADLPNWAFKRQHEVLEIE